MVASSTDFDNLNSEASLNQIIDKTEQLFDMELETFTELSATKVKKSSDQTDEGAYRIKPKDSKTYALFKSPLNQKDEGYVCGHPLSQ